MKSFIRKFRKNLRVDDHPPQAGPSSLSVSLPSPDDLPLPPSTDNESVLSANSDTETLPIFPPEVLAEIFVACLPERDADRLDTNNAPALLCQVSSYWRAVAVSEPRLWDTVIIPTSSNYPLYHKFVRGGGVQRWFDRTGAIWLLTFGEEPSEDPSSSLIDEYLGIVIKYARRFKHLSVVMTKSMHLESFRRGFPRDIFDRLQSVSLCCMTVMDTHTLHAFSMLVTPFLTASKLRHVTFSLPRAEPTKFVLPWTQITSINVDRRTKALNLNQWLQLLEVCPRLQRGAFTYPRHSLGGYQRTVAHACLKSLTLLVPPNHGSHDAPCDIAILFAIVTFSNIQHLHFEFEGSSRNRHIHLDQLAETCSTLSSLQTLTFGWPGDANRDAPVEASKFMTYLTRAEPGVYTSLGHVVIPCRSSKADTIVQTLRSHPQLSVTVTSTPNKVQEWTRAIERCEQDVVDRIYVLSTADYYLLDEDYFRKLL